MDAPARLPPGETPAIAAETLDCGYEGKLVLRDVTFSVAPGEIFFVIGGSGCGKSTLLRHLIGLHEPRRGRVSFHGRPFTAADAAGRRELLRTFGVLFQGGALWSSLTLRENVALPLEEYTPLSRRERGNSPRSSWPRSGLKASRTTTPPRSAAGCASAPGLRGPSRLTPRSCSSTSRPRASIP